MSSAAAQSNVVGVVVGVQRRRRRPPATTTLLGRPEKAAVAVSSAIKVSLVRMRRESAAATHFETV